jgi:hypothetical protein
MRKPQRSPTAPHCLSLLRTNAPSGMSDQSSSSYFRALFEAALQDYEKQIGIALAKRPLPSISRTAAPSTPLPLFFTNKHGPAVNLNLLKNIVSVLRVLLLAPISASLSAWTAWLVCQMALMRVVFQVSDPDLHSISIPARKYNTHRPRHSHLCT